MPIPKPVPREVVCSECGLLWDDHVKPKGVREMPLTECIRLLKARPLSPQWTWTNGGNGYISPTTGYTATINGNGV